MPDVNYKVNLLPPKLQREETVDVRRLLISTGVVLLIAAIVGGYGLFILAFYDARNELAATRTELAAINPLAIRVEKMRAERVELEQTVEEYRLILESRTQWSDLLLDINRIIPVDLWLVDLEVTCIRPEQETSKQGSQGDTPPQGISGNNEGGSGNGGQTVVLLRPNAVIFKGGSRTVASIGVFINDLTRLPYFQEVRLNRISEESDGIGFEITALLKKV